MNERFSNTMQNYGTIPHFLAKLWTKTMGFYIWQNMMIECSKHQSEKRTPLDLWNKTCSETRLLHWDLTVSKFELWPHVTWARDFSPSVWRGARGRSLGPDLWHGMPLYRSAHRVRGTYRAGETGGTGGTGPPGPRNFQKFLGPPEISYLGGTEGDPILLKMGPFDWHCVVF